jgi:Carboxypeptidase regulatory-like domain
MVSSIGKRAALVLALVLCGGVPRASGQVFLGRIDVVVKDATGRALPGVRIAISAPVDAVQTSDAQGYAHFLNLPVESYALTATLTGFTTTTAPNVPVVAGAATTVALTLQPTANAQEGTVAAASVVVDAGRSTITTRLMPQEFQDIPNPRDVWAWLPTVANVYADRINVGSAESGHQSLFTAKGAQPGDNAWSLDGVPVTDMGSPGVSPFFYDVDSPAEMAVTTGSADVRNATGGVQAQIVLKSGGAAPHGGARYYFENDHLQTVNISDELALALGSPTGNTNRIDSYSDYGFDLGGPLLQNHVWVWGTLTKSNVTTLTFNDLTDEVKAHNYALKFDGILTNAIRGNFTFFEDGRTESGRGVGLLRSAESAWNLADPARYYKGEGRFVFGSKLVATARGAYITHAFTMAPAGGLATDYYIDDVGTAHNSYYQLQTTRPQRYAAADATAIAGLHAIDAGFSYRETPIDNLTTYPGSHIVTIWNGIPNVIAQVSRDVHQNTGARYISGFARDTFSLDRLTITGGVRLDRQSSSLKAAAVPAVAGFTTLLPAVTAAARDDVYVWTNITPRAAIAYAAGSTYRVTARGSYALFASQLPGAQAAFASPIQPAFVAYSAVDANGDGVAQASELSLSKGIQGSSGFDVRNPSSTTPVNRVGDTHAPLTHEWTAGVDADVPGNVSLTATLTYRKMVDQLWSPLIGVRAAQYAPAGTLTGTLPELGSFNVPLYALRPAFVPVGGGLESVNRDGYHQRFVGFELGATKRMSNRWMARATLSTNAWREYFDDPSAAIVDPTRAPAPSALRPFAGPQFDGGLIAQLAEGTGQSSVFMVAPKYQFAIDGVLDLPFGIDLAGSLVTRPGYAELFFRSNVDTGDPLGLKTVLLTSAVDAFRLPAVSLLNARLEKKFTFGTAKIAIDFDVFNALNADTVLGKQYDARMTGVFPFGQVLEIMNPRIARLGFRLVF